MPPRRSKRLRAQGSACEARARRRPRVAGREGQTLPRSGLTEALRDLTDRIAGPPGPRVSLTLDLHAPISTSREASEHLYRIAQEALTNAMKHSEAATVEVRLDVDDHTVRLRVLDDG